MNLHEYQAKALLKKYTIPVPHSTVVHLGDKLEVLDDQFRRGEWVVKAQVHAGGRGKAGGIEIVQGDDALVASVKRMLGMRLVTKQTGAAGLPVNCVLIEERVAIKQEFYLSMLIDRANKRIVMIASPAGGMDIEKVAQESPHLIFTETIPLATGVMPYLVRKLASRFKLNKTQQKQLSVIVEKVYQLFLQSDASLVEINPLVVTADNTLMVLDGKINIDDNALYRQPEIAALRDATQEDATESKAKELDLNYVKLDGQIGCIVNGAGLAMATMDLIKLHGGMPANFLDVGGGATAERVSQAFTLVVSDPNVKSIFVNIFGGIVRCDLIAQGVIDAARTTSIKIPVVALLLGTNAEQGQRLLKASGLNIHPATDMSEAAKHAIRLAQS